MIEPVLAHFVADWLFQSQYMASNKVKAWQPAALHVTVYGLVFWALVQPSWAALAVIVGTHYVIDRYRLARHVNWLANFIAPWHRTKVSRRPHFTLSAEMLPDEEYEFTRWRSTNPPWSECKTYGSPPDVPDHVAFMVLIVVDQIMHLLCNYAALRWLG